MAIVIDRRLNGGGKSTENRKKLLKRVRAAIKDQLPKIIGDRNATDLGKKGGTIVIPKKTIKEPTFTPGNGGQRDHVLPGNDRFVPGDVFEKPEDGGGDGGPSEDPSEADDLIINISREEFLNYIFEDLELPNLVRKELSTLKENIKRHAGYQIDGSPNKLSVIRSYKQSMLRRLPIAANIRGKIEELSEFMEQIHEQHIIMFADYSMELGPGKTLVLTPDIAVGEGLQLISDAIEYLESRLENIPTLDPIDLRYKQTITEAVPTTHATMVMIMDNSGSMGEKEKTIAKKFFFLLYEFLNRQYEDVDIVCISHTGDAREMTEEEFFKTSETGGTVVSSALELLVNIMHTRLMKRTNIYVSQVSDGDNMDYDNARCKELLLEKILPEIQYYAYIQVDQYHDEDDDDSSVASSFSPYLRSYEKGLWKAYSEVTGMNNKFQLKRVYSDKDIFPVFKQLFEKKSVDARKR